MMLWFILHSEKSAHAMFAFSFFKLQASRNRVAALLRSNGELGYLQCAK